jgi:hypothetical protein
MKGLTFESAQKMVERAVSMAREEFQRPVCVAVCDHYGFLMAFAPYYESDYVFLTDCGTLFAPECLLHLMREMFADPTCSAVTGRAVRMTRRWCVCVCVVVVVVMVGGGGGGAGGRGSRRACFVFRVEVADERWVTQPCLTDVSLYVSRWRVSVCCASV